MKTIVTKEQLQCDWCREQRRVVFDTPTHFGPWGRLCEECMELHGIMTSVTTKLVRI